MYKFESVKLVVSVVCERVFYLLPVVHYVKLSIVVVNILALDLYNYNCIEIFFTIWSHVILFAVVVAILDFNPIIIFVQFGFNIIWSSFK